MADAIVYQCPNCNGQLAFDSASGKLACAFCGSTYDPVQIEEYYAQKQAAADARVLSQQEIIAEGSPVAIAGDPHGATTGNPPVVTSESPHVVTGESPHVVTGEGLHVATADDPIQTYLQNTQWERFAEDELCALNCSSCGAQLMATQVTAATMCPYCGNATIIPGTLSDALKPNYVIPFKYDREAALAALKNYYRGKKLLPDSFKDENHLEEIQGIYVPFWLYSGTAHASLATEGRTIRTWVDPKNSFVATDRYHVYREGDMLFYHVPVDGSTKMPDAHMDSIEPFDYRELVPFSLGYLPGFLADRYDLSMDDCCGRMRHRIETTCGETLKNTIVGYSEIDSVPATSQLDLTEVAYALLPVWMLHTRWKGNDYLFAMNGQTGKFVGDLPIDTVKMIKNFFKWFIPLAIIVAVFIYFTLGYGF